MLAPLTYRRRQGSLSLFHSQCIALGISFRPLDFSEDFMLPHETNHIGLIPMLYLKNITSKWQKTYSKRFKTLNSFFAFLFFVLLILLLTWSLINLRRFFRFIFLSWFNSWVILLNGGCVIVFKLYWCCCVESRRKRVHENGRLKIHVVSITHAVGYQWYSVW